MKNYRKKSISAKEQYLNWNASFFKEFLLIQLISVINKYFYRETTQSNDQRWRDIDLLASENISQAGNGSGREIWLYDELFQKIGWWWDSRV